MVDSCGAWDRQRLSVNFEQYITSEDSHEAIADGDIAFVGGNHLTPYATRAEGDDWVYLGQTINE